MNIGVDLIKPSFDLGNLSLIENIAKSKVPTVFCGTGGGKKLNILKKV